MALKLGKTPYLDAYINHRAHSKKRGIGFRISFDDWLAIWWESGHIDERGKHAGQYVMARIDDQGAYEVGNVCIVTCNQNHREKIASPETKAKLSEAMTGRYMSESHKANIGSGHRFKSVSLSTRRKLSEAARNRRRK